MNTGTLLTLGGTGLVLWLGVVTLTLRLLGAAAREDDSTSAALGAWRSADYTDTQGNDRLHARGDHAMLRLGVPLGRSALLKNVASDAVT